MEQFNYKGLKALVVDDYPTMRARVTDILKKLEMESDEASNGQEALEKLQEKPYDIIFTDLVMPVMDGFEFCAEARRISKLVKTPIVVTSTHYDSKYIVKALRKGADDYIPKPMNLDLAKKVIHRVMTPVLKGDNNG